MTDASPPRKAPSFFSGGFLRMGSDEPRFRMTGRFKFEFFGDPEDDPELAARHYAGEIAGAFAEARWRTSSGWTVAPGSRRSEGDRHEVDFTAAHPDRKSAAAGMLRLEAHPSNWVRADVIVGGETVFTGFLDRVWEQFDIIWPPGADGNDEAPARIGKRMDWAGVDIAAWPLLAPIAAEGGVLVDRDGDD